MSKKMTINVLNRDETEFTRERVQDKMKVFRNNNPVLHPFQKAREYTRALNAVKLDKTFAKPFLYALDGHADAVYAMSRVPNHLPLILSGDGQGMMKLWHLGSRKCQWTGTAHHGQIRGITTDPFGELAFSCGLDKTVKMWNIHVGSAMNYENSGASEEERTLNNPINVFLGKHNFNGIHHHASRSQFATCGATVDIWDHARSDPIHSFQWGADSVMALRFNPVDTDVLISAASDRSLVLYDVRAKSPLKKLVMYHFSNAIAWNPMESNMFSAANEDQNIYTFDMRKLERAVSVHEDHTSAVTSIDYSPTGKEFVTGSYDKTIRIFPTHGTKSREVYHAKRMQRVYSVVFSGDNKYILSGSDDTNIRLWKTKANEKLGVLLPRQVVEANYREKLKERYENAPEVSRIMRHQHVPKRILKDKKLKQVQKESAQRKADNIRRHTSTPIEQKSKKEARIVKVLD